MKMGNSRTGTRKNFVIWGKNTVLESLRSGRRLIKISAYKGTDPRELIELRALAQANSVPIQYCDREELQRLTGTDKNQGILAIMEDLPALGQKEAFEHLDSLPKPRLVIILDSINDPQNLGSILRSGAAAGASLVLMNEVKSCPVSETVARVSEGGIFYLPVALIPNIAQAIRVLKDKEYWIYGFEADARENYWSTDLKGDVALVFGSEGDGLRELTKKSCDLLLKIPISGPISSLNVAVSAALGIFEVLRQRKSQK